MSRRRNLSFEQQAELDPTRARAILANQRKYHITPHPGQIEIDRATARFQIVRAGRRFGKTKIAARKLVRHAIKNPGSMDWWVANTYKNVRRGYKEVLRQLPPQMLAKPAPPSTSN